jgi:hypothetical protein
MLILFERNKMKTFDSKTDSINGLIVEFLFGSFSTMLFFGLADEIKKIEKE